MSEAKSGLKARVETELAAAADDKELEVLRDRFAAEERAIEHQIDHTVHQFSAALEVCPIHMHIDHHEPKLTHTSLIEGGVQLPVQVRRPSASSSLASLRS